MKFYGYDGLQDKILDFVIEKIVLPITAFLLIFIFLYLAWAAYNYILPWKEIILRQSEWTCIESADVLVPPYVCSAKPIIFCPGYMTSVCQQYKRN